MRKYSPAFIFSIIFFLFIETMASEIRFPPPSKDDVVVLVLDSKNVQQSLGMINTMKTSAVTTEIKENNQNYYFFYGDLQPDYCKEHGITEFPALLRFRRSQDNNSEFYETRRMVGAKTISYIINFISFKQLSDIQPQQPRFPDPTLPYNPSVAPACPPGGS